MDDGHATRVFMMFQSLAMLSDVRLGYGPWRGEAWRDATRHDARGWRLVSARLANKKAGRLAVATGR